MDLTNSIQEVPKMIDGKVAWYINTCVEKLGIFPKSRTDIDSWNFVRLPSAHGIFQNPIY